MSLTLLSLFHIASVYGAGGYNDATYNNTLVSIGPITLPDTGAGWSVLGGTALLAIGSGVSVWVHQRKRYAPHN